MIHVFLFPSFGRHEISFSDFMDCMNSDSISLSCSSLIIQVTEKEKKSNC